jgi:hypothetical protein
MPYFAQERERGRQYDEQVRSLATQLGLKDADLMMKQLSEGSELKEIGGFIIDPKTYKESLRGGKDPQSAFNDAVVIQDRGAPQKNAEALAEIRIQLEQMKQDPNVDPEALSRKQAELDAMEWQLKPQEQKNSATFSIMGPDGTFTTVTGSPSDMANAVAVLRDDKQAKALQTKQQATDRTLGYTSRILGLLEDAETAATGRLGGMASSLSIWSKAIDETLSGPRGKQFQDEVGGNPQKYLEELMRDPEAENYMTPSLYEKLSEIGQTDARLLSNIIGLGYATARASDEGGRLSNSDVAFALNRVGYDLDALLNDPARVRAGVLELAGSAVGEYEGALELSGPDGSKMVENDALLNRRLGEYGFEWTGGPRGQLKWGPAGQSESGAAPGGAVQPIDNVNGTPVYDGTSLTREQAQQLPSGTLIRVPDGKGGTKMKRIP